MDVQAVLTGDIVNSTRLGSAAEKKLLRHLQQVLAQSQYEFYRGDSFQVCLKEAEMALQVALLCRSAAISTGWQAAAIAADIRISIGIGKVNKPVGNLGTAKGEAFVLSGRAFDALTAKDSRLALTVGNKLANAGLAVIADYTNAIFKNMTGKQAGVIFELLKGETQQAVAKKMKNSKSTISQHASAGRWPEIEQVLQHYKDIINQII